MSDIDACPECLRRTVLLGMLGPYIERSPRPWSELISMPDTELVEMVAGAQATEILARATAEAGSGLRGEIEAAGCWAVCLHSDHYPTALRGAPSPPSALIARGDRMLLHALSSERTVAVCGSRRATSYGREVARTLAHELGSTGTIVVSGLAFGIDACAHRGSLDAGAPTIAVLGCGPDVAYPAGHRGLWRRVAETGLVLSELPPGSTPWRWTFPARNRIIAGLAGMTVVVEAAARSGSLVTARLASESGRGIGAVPGPVTSRASAGPNSLLAEGAVVVRGAADVLEALA